MANGRFNIVTEVPTPETIEAGLAGPDLAAALGLAPMPAAPAAPIAQELDREANLSGRAQGFDLIRTLAMVAGLLTGQPLPLVLGELAGGEGRKLGAAAERSRTGRAAREADAFKRWTGSEEVKTGRMNALAAMQQAAGGGRGSEAAGPKTYEAFIVQNILPKMQLGQPLNEGEQIVFDNWVSTLEKQQTIDPMTAWLAGQLGLQLPVPLSGQMKPTKPKKATAATAAEPEGGEKLPKALDGVVGKKNQDRYTDERGWVYDWDYDAQVWKRVK